MICDAHGHVSILKSDYSKVHLVSTRLSDWNELALDNYNAYMTSIGIHPWNIDIAQKSDLSRLKTILRLHPHIQLGETGLDYSHKEIDKEKQLEFFKEQLKLAYHLDRIVTIHAVQCWGDLILTIEEIGTPEAGMIIHGFRGSAEVVNRLSKLGVYFSLGEREVMNCGEKQKRAISTIPELKLLVETDVSGSLERAVSGIAEIRNMSKSAVKELVNSNFDNLFTKKR